MKEIIKYETASDWSYKMSMETKLSQMEKYCGDSKFVKETAERLGLKYFDVSFDRDKVFDEIMRYLKQNID